MLVLVHILVCNLVLQANGIGRDFLNDDSVYIFDMYNRSIYPQDGYAKSTLN